MNVLETKYRLLTIQEDIEHLRSKIEAIGKDPDLSQADYDHLMSMSWNLKRATQRAQCVSLTGTASNLVTLLEASIDGSVRARRLHEVVRAETNNAG